jgi:O-antigen ligase
MENIFLLLAIFAVTAGMIIKPKWALKAILFLPLVGELYRLPIGPDNGLIVTDLIIPLFSGIWCFKKLLENKKTTHKSKLVLPLFLFSAAAIFSLSLSIISLPIKEVLLGSTYLIRYISYALLAFIVIDEIENEKEARSLINCIIAAGVLIAVAGFIQLIVYPDLKALEEYGWDPHINRLVSTWLDPNFVGGFLAMVISIALSLALTTKKLSQKIGLLTIIAILGLGLFFTYSRSAYVALAVSLFIIGLLRSRIMIVTCIILFIIGVNTSERAAERVEGLVTSAQSLIFQSAQNPDPTARLRIKSWEQTLSLIQKRPIQGSGYNTLKYVNYQEGFVQNTDIHSASGSDASLLTILATTGILGFIPFLWMHFLILKSSWKAWRGTNKNSLTQGFSLGLFAALLGLLTHSLFVNSLLFAPILLYLWISVGIQEKLAQISFKNPA